MTPRAAADPSERFIGAHRYRGAAQRRAEFLFEARRDRVPTARQRSDDHPVGGIEFVDHGAGHVPEPTGHPVSLHRTADGLGDDESDPGPVCCVVEERNACTTMSGCTARIP